MARNRTIARYFHDGGIAVWFGGTLMGLLGLRGAAGGVDDPRERVRLEEEGWRRWAPVSAAAIAGYYGSGPFILWTSKGRLTWQRGVARNTWIITGLAIAATAAAASERALARRLREAMRSGSTVGGDASDDGNGLGSALPEEAERSRRNVLAARWAMAVTTGAMLVVSIRMSEQQRTSEVLAGISKRFVPGRLRPGG